MSANGIFCLEGEWDPDMRKRRSVLPILELLERLGEIKFIHRDVGTAGEVERYLSKWKTSRYDDYQILYIAGHGDKGRIFWSADRVAAGNSSLEELAEALGGGATGCYIYLGGCLTLFDNRALERFIAATGADAVLGYRKPVDWLEAAAFEVLLLSWMANHTGRPKTLFNQLMTRHSELAKHLKFVVGTRAGIWRAQDHTDSRLAT